MDEAAPPNILHLHLCEYVCLISRLRLRREIRNRADPREHGGRVLGATSLICFSATAFAQGAPPKIGNKRLVQVKPKDPMGCKLVGTVRRTKLWAGDCVGSELRGSTTTTETQALPEQATGAITPDQKE